MPLNLPENFDFELPDFQNLAQSAIGYTPNPSLPRVTDGQRETDKQILKEQGNAADNLADSIKVSNKYLQGAIKATQLVKSTISYQIGIQDIRTEGINLQKAYVRTDLANSELAELNIKLDYQNRALPLLQEGLNHQLRELASKTELAAKKAEYQIEQTASKFNTIDVQSRLAA